MWGDRGHRQQEERWEAVVGNCKRKCPNRFCPRVYADTEVEDGSQLRKIISKICRILTTLLSNSMIRKMLLPVTHRKDRPPDCLHVVLLWNTFLSRESNFQISKRPWYQYL